MDFLNVNLVPIVKIRDKVRDNSILFNKIVNGKGIEDYSKWELVSKINSQYLIAKEEVDEFFTAKENNDIVEMYDGAIDTFYTVPFLVQLLNEYEIRYDTEYDGYTHAELDILEQGSVDVLFEATELDLDILSEYADRVIANNMEKFTTDEAVIAGGMDMLYFLVPYWITYISIEILSGTIRGCGSSFIPMIITVFGVCVLRIVWIFTAGAKWPSVRTILASYPITWIVTSILFWVYYFCGKWKKNNS